MLTTDATGHEQTRAGVHKSFTWKPRNPRCALLSRKTRVPRLSRQARQPLGPFISFGTWHVQAWKSGEALLSFHSGRAWGAKSKSS